MDTEGKRGVEREGKRETGRGGAEGFTGTASLKEEGVAIVPEEHSSLSQPVDGRDVTTKTAISQHGSKRIIFVKGVGWGEDS